MEYIDQLTSRRFTKQVIRGARDVEWNKQFESILKNEMLCDEIDQFMMKQLAREFSRIEEGSNFNIQPLRNQAQILLQLAPLLVQVLRRLGKYVMDLYALRRMFRTYALAPEGLKNIFIFTGKKHTNVYLAVLKLMKERGLIDICDIPIWERDPTMELTLETVLLPRKSSAPSASSASALNTWISLLNTVHCDKVVPDITPQWIKLSRYIDSLAEEQRRNLYEAFAKVASYVIAILTHSKLRAASEMMDELCILKIDLHKWGDSKVEPIDLMGSLQRKLVRLAVKYNTTIARLHP